MVRVVYSSPLTAILFNFLSGYIDLQGICEATMNSNEPESDGVDATERRFSKAELMREIEEAWSALNAYLATLTPAQLSEIRDAAGWAVKDFLTHLAAWERSVAQYLQGRPRYEGLGVERELFLAGDVDAINAVIQQQWSALSGEEALADLRAGHRKMLELLAPLSDADLAKANSEYAPSASGVYDARPISGIIYANTADHFREHLGYIENLVSK
jgi:hypothetical protein